jgi:hypothetical protein
MGEKILKIYGVAGVIFAYLLIELLCNQMIIADTGIYWYMGHQLLAGKALYKNIVLDNLPLVPYMAALYNLISGGNILFYFYSSALEGAGMAILIYQIIQKQYRNYTYALSGVVLFLFSNYMLQVGHYQIGITTAGLFALLGYYLLLRKKPGWAGVSMGIAILTKAYFLPIVGVISVWAYFQFKKKEMLRYGLGMVMTGAAVMLPFAINSPQQLYYELTGYALQVRENMSKGEMAGFFAKTDWAMTGLLAFSLIWCKKNKLAAGISLIFLLFLLFYKDFHYVYFGMVVPWLAIWSADALSLVNKKWIIAIPLASATVCLYIFFSGLAQTGRVGKFAEMVNDLKQLKPNYLYGVNLITPALAYSSGVPLWNDLADTSENLYRSGAIDRRKWLAEASQKGTIIVTYGLDYPEAGVKDDTYTNLVDKEQYAKYCKVIKSYEVVWGSYMVNRINFSTCQGVEE